ncbi:MAG: cell division protein FtsZ [Mediterranea sp.]|jgi:cell division protein FtsZ|nr:cell division protein FtsZ [Mediterranea sp.]
MTTKDIVEFDLPTDSPKIIKVIGVGGGGGNAVNHMYREGIHDVTFVLCNTDNQALKDSPVPVKLQLGRTITEGLGAGNRPERAREAAEESAEELQALLSDGTKMVFITAGMGGGTGTGAAPVIARIAKEMDILTVGIVTIPFIFEGGKKIIQALDGVEQIARHVDALLVINNERLREIYSDLTFMNAFGKADDTLSIAAKSIAEIITVRGKVNLDFADVKTILKDGGVAIMSTGFGEGENRVTKAIDDALNSPLLNNNDIFNAKKVMLNVSFCESAELMMEEMNEVHDFMHKFRDDVEVIWGVAIDNELEGKIKITILSTGFGVDDVPGMNDLHEKRTQEEEERLQQLEELKERNNVRIEQTYGKNALGSSEKNNLKRLHIYLFNPEDLDNVDIISMVENSPTYRRDKTTLNAIREKAKEEEETVENLLAGDDGEDGVIRF